MRFPSSATAEAYPPYPSSPVDPTLAAWLDDAATPDEQFIEAAWRLILRQKPDETGRERALRMLAEGTLSRATLLKELVSDAPFARIAAFDDALARSKAAWREGERPRNLAGPAGYDERIIEIPWCLSRYGGESRVLDVGYAFAEPAWILGLLALDATDLVALDLVDVDIPGLRRVVGDLRELPFANGSLELAFCVSTLEHIGKDNTVYGLGDQHDNSGIERALAEFRRVLEPDGRLLISVPCGEEQDLGWQVQLPPAQWVKLFEDAGFLVFEDEIYELGPEGWASTGSFEPDGVRYGDRGPGASAVLCAELRPRRLSKVLGLIVRDLRHRNEPRRSTRGHGGKQ